MYCVKVLYPNRAGSTFNLEHYFNFHVPTGLKLLKKLCNVVPSRIEADVRPVSVVAGALPPCHLIFSAYFPTSAEAESFKVFLNLEEAAILNNDYPNFTQAEPEIMITEVLDVDPVTGQPR